LKLEKLKFVTLDYQVHITMFGDKDVLMWVCFYKNCLPLQIKKFCDFYKIAVPMTKLRVDDEIRAFDGNDLNFLNFIIMIMLALNYTACTSIFSILFKSFQNLFCILFIIKFIQTYARKYYKVF
jgi:hypothetical protein